MLLTGLILLTGIFNCSPYSLPKDRYSYRDKNAFEFYLKSVDYFFNSEYQEALETIQKAIKLNKSFAQFHKLEGDIYFNLKHDDKALISYENALKYRSYFTEVYLAMAVIYKRNNDHANAVKAYDKVLLSDQKQIVAYLELADCYLVLDKSKLSLNSLEAYEKATIEYKVEPVSDYFYLLAKTYFQLKKYHEAIAELEKIKEPFNEKVYCLLGRCYYGLNEFDTGLHYFNKLLNNNNIGEYYYYRGIYFYNKNNLEDALTQFKRALELDESQIEVHYYLSRIYELKGDTEEALKQYKLYKSDVK
jgi:tetratricopeptide (TPR) repeat protein